MKCPQESCRIHMQIEPNVVANIPDVASGVRRIQNLPLVQEPSILRGEADGTGFARNALAIRNSLYGSILRNRFGHNRKT